VPTLAAIVALAAHRARKLATSAPRSKRLGIPMSRRMKYAPASASSVLPVAISAAAAQEYSTVALTRAAPSQTPGQMRGPKTSSAASVMPAGGQIAVA